MTERIIYISGEYSGTNTGKQRGIGLDYRYAKHHKGVKVGGLRLLMSIHVNSAVRPGHVWFMQCLGVIKKISPSFKNYLLKIVEERKLVATCKKSIINS